MTYVLSGNFSIESSQPFLRLHHVMFLPPPCEPKLIYRLRNASTYPKPRNEPLEIVHPPCCVKIPTGLYSVLYPTLTINHR